MKSQFLKLCSMVLIFALLLNLFPAQAIASELDETKIESSSESITSESAASEDTTSEEKPTEEYSAESATIVAENPEKRTAFTKDYKLSNGFNMSVVYPEVVHYEDDGQWKEIDNTLKASGSGENGVYTNTTGGWNAIFPQQLTKITALLLSRRVMQSALEWQVRLDLTLSLCPQMSKQPVP